MPSSSTERHRSLRLEGILAGLLRYGAITAASWISLGMVLDIFKTSYSMSPIVVAISDRCLAIGVVLLITLPVMRVALTTTVFLFEKDYLFATVSGLVLVIITVGFLLGVFHVHGGSP